MEWHHFLAIAVCIVGIMMYINTRSKAKKPYRTDYKPIFYKILKGDDVTMEQLLNSHREFKGLNKLKPCQLLFNLAKEHNLYQVKDGKASHDNSRKRVFTMRTNNAISTGECTANGFSGVKGFFHGYINHKHKTGKKKGKYSHRHIIEGNYTHYGHSILSDSEKKYSVLLVSKY